MEFLTLVGEVGFPIAGALGAGYFVFLTLKFILAGVKPEISLIFLVQIQYLTFEFHH